MSNEIGDKDVDRNCPARWGHSLPPQRNPILPTIPLRSFASSFRYLPAALPMALPA